VEVFEAMMAAAAASRAAFLFAAALFLLAASSRTEVLLVFLRTRDPSLSFFSFLSFMSCFFPFPMVKKEAMRLLKAVERLGME
jgi:hypothetical protein